MPAIHTLYVDSQLLSGAVHVCTDSHENWDDQLIRKTKKLRRPKNAGILGGGEESGIPGANKSWRLGEQPSRKENRSMKPGN